MMEEDDDFRLVLSSSEEDNEDSDSDDGIKIKNITDSDNSVEIVDTVTVSTNAESTGEVFNHEFDDRDVMKLTAKHVKLPNQDVAGQMEDGRWFLIKKCVVLVRSLPITLVRSLQEERVGEISAEPVEVKQARGGEGQARKRRNYDQSCESFKPGLGKQVRKRAPQAGPEGDQEKGLQGYQQSGSVLRDRLSVLVTSLADRVGMGKEKLGVNRLTRGKKRKLRDNDGSEGNDYEVYNDEDESCEEVSQKRLELAVDDNFIEVSRDGEECDDMKTRSDEDCPIDMEDKVAVDPLYSLVKPCYIRLGRIDISDFKETGSEFKEITRDFNKNISDQNEISSDSNVIRSDCKKISRERREKRNDRKRNQVKITGTKVKEVVPTREVGLDGLSRQADDCHESLDDIAIELQKMECAARGNERFGIELDFTAPKEFSSEDDEEALRRIFDSCPVAIPVEKICPAAAFVEKGYPVTGSVEKSCPVAAFVENICPVACPVEKSCPVANPVEKSCPVTGFAEKSRLVTGPAEMSCQVVHLEKRCPVACSLKKSCPVANPVEESCPVTGPVEESSPVVTLTEKRCLMTGHVDITCPVVSPVEKNYDVSGAKVNEVETGVASESGEVCNVVEVDAEAAVQALILPQAVKETANVCLEEEVDGSNINVVEVVNEFNANKLEGAKEKLVPTSNHPDALGSKETVDMEESPEDRQMAGEKLDENKTNNLNEVGSGDDEGAFDDASNGENAGITEILDMELMKGKPLEKFEEIPGEEDNLIASASPSSPHDGEPASPPNSVEIVTDESFEDWESVSFGDWESVCIPNSVEEVNNNTVALTIESNEDQKKIPSGNSLRQYASEKYEESYKKPVGGDEDFSKKSVGDGDEEFPKKPVGDDEVYLSDITGSFCSLASGDEVSCSTGVVLPSYFPVYSSSQALEPCPHSDSSLLGFSAQGSALDEASSQGSSVVKSSSLGSVLVDTASEGSSVETPSQASSVVETSSQGSVFVETASEGSETSSQSSSVVGSSSQSSSVVDESSQVPSVVETLSQATCVVERVETSSQASSVLETSQASVVVETSSQGSFSPHFGSPSRVFHVERARSECQDAEEGVKGSSTVSRANDDHQLRADAAGQDAADICDDLIMTSDDEKDDDDDLLLLTNDIMFDDMRPINSENFNPPGQVVAQKTSCQETSSPICVVSSKSVDVYVPSLPIDVPSLPVDVPSLPAEVPSLPVDVPSLPDEVPSLPVDVPSLPVDVPSLPAEVPSLPIDVPSLPAEVPSLPVAVPSREVFVPSNKAVDMGSVVEASVSEELSSYLTGETRDIIKSGKVETKSKESSRKQSIFDITIDEFAVSEANCATASCNSSPNLSSFVKGFAREIISNVSSPSLPCSSTSSTAKCSKEARASCPQSPSITSSTGPPSAHYEESDSDSSSDDDVIILEESGVSSSIVNQAKATPTLPEKRIKNDKKVPQPRPNITNVNVDMWKGLGSEVNQKYSVKKGVNKKTKSKEPNKEINGNTLKTKRSDSQHPRFKSSESHRSKFNVLPKDSLTSESKAAEPPHANSKANPSPSLQFKIPKGPSKVLGNASHYKEMIQYGGKLVRIKNFLKEEDIIPNYDQLLQDENWQKIESMYDKVTNIKKSASDKKINDIVDENEVNDLKSQNLELEKLETDQDRKKFSKRQFKNSVSTDPANNLTFHGFRSLKNSNRTKNLPTDSFSISGGKLLPQPGFKRRNWTEGSKEREALEKKKIKINDFGLVMKKVFVHKFNKKLRSTKSKGRQAELDEFLTYLGHYKTGQEETANFLTYYNSSKELNLDQVKEVIDVENQYSTFTSYYGEAGDFFCKDCNKRHKFCQ